MPLRLFLLLALLLLFAVPAPAAADWRYAPPPVGAVVTYDDGRVSRIASADDQSIVLVESLNGVDEVIDYRTWILRVRIQRQGQPGEILLETAAEESLLQLWPLRRGESMAYAYEALQDGSRVLNGQVVLSYGGEETLELDFGSVRAHCLVRDYSYTEASGKDFRGNQTTWHDIETGLIVKVAWESDGPSGKLSGSYVATKIELP